jgi:glucose/arabinose dehydrogenase
MKKIYALIFFSFLFCIKGFTAISLVQFATGFSSPVDIKNAGDNRMFIVEQAGYIKMTDSAGNLYPSNFLDIHTRVISGGERGLLGLAFPPDFATSGYFYVDYTRQTDGWTRISRFSVSATNPDSADPNSEQILLTIRQPQSNHNGGNVKFGPDGYLYIGMGDGGNGGDQGTGHNVAYGNAQSIDSLLGKILRIDVSTPAYTSPPDNPFVGIAGRDEIWNVGMRNPWRWSFDRWNGDFWIGDVGQDAWEEVDHQPAGTNGNLGWRCYEGNHDYNTSNCGPMSNYIGPVYEYPHAGAAATVGGYVYRGAEYADMFGKYFLSDEYTTTYGFRTLTPNGSGGYTAALLGNLGRSTVVTFGEDRWGELYCADYGNGRIYKFQSDTCNPVAFISTADTIYVCDTVNPYVLRTPEGYGFHFEWFRNSITLGNDNDSLTVTQGGNYSVVSTNSHGCTASTSVQVIYSGPPQVNFTGLLSQYCLGETPTSILTGSPAGGTFSGYGVTGTDTIYFDPTNLSTPGFDTITYNYTDTITGCSNSIYYVTNLMICDGISENSSIRLLSLYPNPNNGDFTLKIYLTTDELLNAEVIDVIGKTIYREDIHAESGIHTIPMNLKQFAKGIYSLKVSGKNGNAVKRFVIE